MITPRDPRTVRLAARQLTEALRSGRCLADRTFDRFLPEPLNAVSPQYWSPLVVAKRAAEWFDDVGIHSVVDIGSGAGKFCVAGALFGRCHFIGLEQRAFLVASARALAQLFDVNDRVRFVHGALGAAPTPVADAYYLFNPFGEYRFGSDHLVDMDVAHSDERHARDIAAVEALLQSAPVQTCVLTYNGFGGRIPDSYDLILVDWQLPGALRLWRKTRKEGGVNSRLSHKRHVRGDSSPGSPGVSVNRGDTLETAKEPESPPSTWKKTTEGARRATVLRGRA